MVMESVPSIQRPLSNHIPTVLTSLIYIPVFTRWKNNQNRKKSKNKLLSNSLLNEKNAYIFWKISEELLKCANLNTGKYLKQNKKGQDHN
jgi:hypothetical protein